VDVLAGSSIDELDQPTFDDIERRIPLAMLIEDLPRLETESLPTLRQPLELAVREPREQDLVTQIGKPIAPHHPRRCHAPRLARAPPTAHSDAYEEVELLAANA
jgi:hypothetical protein